MNADPTSASSLSFSKRLPGFSSIGLLAATIFGLARLGFGVVPVWILAVPFVLLACMDFEMRFRQARSVTAQLCLIAFHFVIVATVVAAHQQIGAPPDPHVTNALASRAAPAGKTPGCGSGGCGASGSCGSTCGGGQGASGGCGGGCGSGTADAKKTKAKAQAMAAASALQGRTGIPTPRPMTSPASAVARAAAAARTRSAAAQLARHRPADAAARPALAVTIPHAETLRVSRRHAAAEAVRVAAAPASVVAVLHQVRIARPAGVAEMRVRVPMPIAVPPNATRMSLAHAAAHSALVAAPARVRIRAILSAPAPVPTPAMAHAPALTPTVAPMAVATHRRRAPARMSAKVASVPRLSSAPEIVTRHLAVVRSPGATVSVRKTGSATTTVFALVAGTPANAHRRTPATAQDYAKLTCPATASCFSILPKIVIAMKQANVMTTAQNCLASVLCGKMTLKIVCVRIEAFVIMTA